jgi:hypothetical protein
MNVDCPECGARLTGTPGAEMVCPACMTPFLVPTLGRAVRVFDVQPSGDAVVHALPRHAIREAIYTGRLDATTQVRHDGGPWELIGGYPEFAAVFRLLGGDLAPMAGTRKLAGWGRGATGRRPLDIDEPTAPSRTGTPRFTAPPPAVDAGAALHRPPAPPSRAPDAAPPRATVVTAAFADTRAVTGAPPAVKVLPPPGSAPVNPWVFIGAGATALLLLGAYVIGT